MRFRFYLIACTIFCSTCSGQGNKSPRAGNNPDAVRLNNLAMDIYIKNFDNEDSLNKSLDYLKQAVSIDSSYILAYSNMISILCGIGKCKQSLALIDKILKLNSALTDYKLIKGHILERLGENTDALLIYNEAINDYTKRIELDSNNVNLLLARSFALFFAEGKEKGMTEFNRIASMFPDNTEVSSSADIFKTFNKEAFLKSICSNPSIN